MNNTVYILSRIKIRSVNSKEQQKKREPTYLGNHSTYIDIVMKEGKN